MWGTGWFDQLLQVVLPKGKGGKPGGVSVSNTFSPTNDKVTIPQFSDHLTNIYDQRLSVNDSRDMVKFLMRNDTDFSATKDAYLTLGDQEPTFSVYGPDGQIDPTGHDTLEQIMDVMFLQNDYTLGFTPVQTFRSISERMRYMFLSRGCVVAELVLDKQRLPSTVRLADPKTIEWHEITPGVLKMIQIAPQGGTRIDLDVPTIFVNFYHQDPTEIYPIPHFQSAINSVAARQAVIQTLYQIMRNNGAPRLTVKIIEEVARKNMPSDVSADPVKAKAFMADILGTITAQISSLRPDQAFVHYDTVEPAYLDQKGSRAGMEQRIGDVMSSLDNQNQAGLKTMGTVIGRGESGVNTGSVEARMFALNADGLNHPIGEIWGQVLTLALRLTGYQGYVDVGFKPVELRPELELEPQRLIKQQRLLQDLSLGLITDIEYHQMMYNRLPPKGAPELSATGFMHAAPAGAQSPSPNSDPLGRSVSGGSKASKAAKSNGVGKKTNPRTRAANAAAFSLLNEDDNETIN